MVHTCTFGWGTPALSGGTHLHPQVAHTCTLRCCTPAPSGGTHLHPQVLHTCTFRWYTSACGPKCLHSQYLKRQKQADDKLEANLGYIGKSRLSIKKNNQPTPSPNKIINQSITYFISCSSLNPWGRCHGCGGQLYCGVISDGSYSGISHSCCVFQLLRK